MKYLMFVILSLFASLFISDEVNGDYDKLWKQVAKDERKLPKSAYAIVEQIYDKALTEKRDDQLIKSIIYKAKLSRYFEDNDPAAAIKKMEVELANIQSNSAKAVYCSLLGESYSQYGMNNSYRFQNRTRLENESEELNDELPFESLEEIQKISVDYYQQSLSYKLDTKLDDLSLLITDDKKAGYLRATNLEQFLVFRALQHFKDTRSLVSLSTESYSLSNPALFDYDFQLEDGDFDNLSSEDYLLLGTTLFQKAKTLAKLDTEQKIFLELMRLEYLKSYALVNDKDSLYLLSLEKLGKQYEGKKGYEAAYCQLISIYLDKGRSALHDKTTKVKGHFSKAASLLSELESKSDDEYYEGFIANLRTRLTKVELDVKLEQVNVKDKPFLARLQYRNASELEYTIVRLEGADFDKYNKSYKPVDRIKLVKSLKGGRVAKLKLEKGNDFEYHSIEFPIEGLSSGRYVMMTKHEPTHSKESDVGIVLSLFHVSNLAYVSMNGMDNSEGFVVDRVSGVPIEKVTIEVFVQQYDQSSRKNKWHQLSTLYSDKDGRFKYEGEGRSFSYKLIYENDYLDLNENHYYNKRRKSNKSHQVQLFTDRAIYRPGQTIYYKGLVIEKDEEQLPSIVDNKKVEVIFRDANWQIVKQETMTSDAYGTFHGTLTAPEGSLTGRMQIEAKIEGRSFQTAIRVEEYKRPKLLAKIDKVTEAYALGDTVTLSGTLNSYSGATISNAKVKYRVERQAARRWGWYWRSRPQSGRALEQVAAGVLKLSEDGAFQIDFPTQLGSNAYVRYNYVAHFDFTDSTGESASATKKLVLGAVPFYLSIDMEESCFQKDLKDIQVKALNSENEGVKVSGVVQVQELAVPMEIKRKKYWPAPELDYLDKKAYESQFPWDSYGAGDDPSEWKTKAVVLELVDQQLGTIDIKSLKAGAYKITLTVKDTKGNTQTEERYLFVSANKGRALPAQHLWTSTIKDTYQPNEVLSLKVSTPYPQAQLLYRIRRAHDNILTEWNTLESGTEIEYPISEEHRGGFTIDLAMVKNNRIYTKKFDINVPWSNKELHIEYATFRDKLTPGVEESWKLKIKDAEGMPVTAELLVAMYDASLDQFVPHKWMQNFYPSYYAYGDWNGKGFTLGRSYAFLSHKRMERFHIRGFQPQLNLFGYSQGRHGGGEVWEEVTTRRSSAGKEQRMMKSAPAPAAMMEDSGMSFDADSNDQQLNSNESLDAVTITESTPDLAFDELSIRENLNETVFFFPDLEVKNGEVELSFKMNEALTKWKLLLFAHSKDLEYAFDTKEIITQKQLMIEPHMPRFVRQGDKININAKISNLTEETIQTSSKIQILDAMTGEELTGVLLQDSRELKNNLAAKESSTVEWIFEIPSDLNSALIIKMMTQGGGHSDGEQNIIPVLSNRKLVTETMPLHLPGGMSKQFDMTGMEKMSGSTTLANHNYTIELTTNPAWLVANAIPYLTTGTRPSSPEIFNVMYGNLLMQDLLVDNPDIRKAIETWKAKDLKSALSKNQELKLSTLEETPWVRAAQSEEEQLAKLKIFLDDNYINGQVSSAVKKLKARQLDNGGFVWMPGGRDNWFVTQNILEGIGKLNKLGIESGLTDDIAHPALDYIDKRLIKYHNESHNRNREYIDPLAIHYLYVRSFFMERPIDSKLAKVMDFYFDKGDKYWPEQGSYQQGLLAIAAARYERAELASSIMASLKERMIKNDELGYYWNDQAGYYWYNLNIEKQALMIELFQELDGSQADIDGLKLWLFKTKQTNSWKTSKATSAACYAFLSGSEKWLTSSETIDLSFPLEKKQIEFSDQEYATGYVKKTYPAAQVSETKKQLEVTNPNEGVAWGAVYWQYFEELDNIENFQDTPLKLVKEVYIVGVDDSGEILRKISSENPLVPGDRLRIRIHLQVDRPMEFIEMKDMRSSGLEPQNVLSTYKWQDGLSYYESTKDLASYFYFDFLPKGSWVFEYDVKAAHKGTFSNGITEIQSVYAPEFASHSNGVGITVTKE